MYEWHQNEQRSLFSLASLSCVSRDTGSSSSIWLMTTTATEKMVGTDKQQQNTSDFSNGTPPTTRRMRDCESHTSPLVHNESRFVGEHGLGQVCVLTPSAHRRNHIRKILESRDPNGRMGWMDGCSESGRLERQKKGNILFIKWRSDIFRHLLEPKRRKRKHFPSKFH